VAPTLKSTEGICATPTTSGDVIGQISQCELLLEDDLIPWMVGIRKIFEGTTFDGKILGPLPSTLHNVALPLMW